MSERYVPVYDKNKLAELVVYIATKTAGSRSFGKTKLNKTLFFSDFLHFREYLTPITGSSYEKYPYGPVPVDIEEIKQNLVNDGSILITEVKVIDYPQERITALREPKLSLFSDIEISRVDDLIETFADLTASAVSDVSHKWSAGWQLADDREIIPYETAFLTTQVITEEEVEMLRDKLKLSV